MQAMHEQQVGDQLIADEALGKHPVAVVGRHLLDDALESGSVELDDRLDQGRGQLARAGVVDRLERLEHALDFRHQLGRSRRLSAERHQLCSPNIGWWTLRRVLPLPRYMCTPQGRHGSNERTARMMSIPRKSSWPFSSKIGMPMTASS